MVDAGGVVRVGGDALDEAVALVVARVAPARERRAQRAHAGARPVADERARVLRDRDAKALGRRPRVDAVVDADAHLVVAAVRRRELARDAARLDELRYGGRGRGGRGEQQQEQRQEGPQRWCAAAAAAASRVLLLLLPPWRRWRRLDDSHRRHQAVVQIRGCGWWMHGVR